MFEIIGKTAVCFDDNTFVLRCDKCGTVSSFHAKYFKEYRPDKLTLEDNVTLKCTYCGSKHNANDNPCVTLITHGTFVFLEYRPEYRFICLHCCECGYNTFIEKDAFREISPQSIILKECNSVSCCHCGKTHTPKDGCIYPAPNTVYIPVSKSSCESDYEEYYRISSSIIID